MQEPKCIICEGTQEEKMSAGKLHLWEHIKRVKSMRKQWRMKIFNKMDKWKIILMPVCIRFLPPPPPDVICNWQKSCFRTNSASSKCNWLYLSQCQCCVHNRLIWQFLDQQGLWWSPLRWFRSSCPTMSAIFAIMTQLTAAPVIACGNLTVYRHLTFWRWNYFFNFSTLCI
jgi:hypothetical protein